MSGSGEKSAPSWKPAEPESYSKAGRTYLAKSEKAENQWQRSLLDTGTAGATPKALLETVATHDEEKEAGTTPEAIPNTAEETRRGEPEEVNTAYRTHDHLLQAQEADDNLQPTAEEDDRA